MANINFLLSLVCTLLMVHILLCTTATSGTTINDIEGNPLQVGSAYYIQSATFGFVGGFRLKLRPDQNQSPFTCPRFVFRTPVEVDMGIPVMFTPSNRTETIITSSTDTLISFSGFTVTCPKTWSLTEDSGRMYVSTGVYVDRFQQVSKNTQLNVPFKINPVRQAGSKIYFITYSPESELALGALALFDEDGTNWLGVTFNAQPPPLRVYFVKMENSPR
ncbi:Kunitz family serine protease inhibitor, partial [Clostridium perfringens]|nr:Kunitz family serine protease inhibitor [Clostridium perfringens]